MNSFGIGNTEIKRYKADPYNGYLPLFNQDLFQLRKGPNPSKANAGESGDIYTDYRTQTGKS